jgi:hypothetical protein
VLRKVCFRRACDRHLINPRSFPCTFITAAARSQRPLIDQLATLGSKPSTPPPTDINVDTEGTAKDAQPSSGADELNSLAAQHVDISFICVDSGCKSLPKYPAADINPIFFSTLIKIPRSRVRFLIPLIILFCHVMRIH